MSITEVENISYFSKIKNSLKGIVFGAILIIIGVGMLWWNEGRAVKRTKALEEGASAVITIDSNKISQENNNKLVHLTGKVTTDEMLVAPVWNFKENALRLASYVQMYQWEENSDTTEEKKLGGSTEKKTTYTYKKVWSNVSIDSSAFKEADHDNPATISVSEFEVDAKNAKLNAFNFSESLVKKLHDFQALTIKNDLPVNKINQKAKVVNGEVYIGNNPSVPEIGDIKIAFKMVPCGNVSVVAQQVNGELTTYLAKTGTILLVSPGILSAEMMFQNAKDGNKFLTWILRIVGTILIISGFSSILSIFAVLGDIVPFIGNLISIGTGLIAIILGLVLSVLVVALAWITYRPLLGISLLVIVGIIIFVIIKYKKKVSVA